MTEPCAHHNELSKSVSELPEIKKILDNVNKMTTEIYVFLNGNLGTKGWLTKQDERIWVLEQWQTKMSKGVLFLLRAAWTVIGIGTIAVVTFLWGLLSHKIKIGF